MRLSGSGSGCCTCAPWEFSTLNSSPRESFRLSFRGSLPAVSCCIHQPSGLRVRLSRWAMHQTRMRSLATRRGASGCHDCRRFGAPRLPGQRATLAMVRMVLGMMLASLLSTGGRGVAAMPLPGYTLHAGVDITGA